MSGLNWNRARRIHPRDAEPTTTLIRSQQRFSNYARHTAGAHRARQKRLRQEFLAREALRRCSS